jgi:hypothetical protein
MIQRMGDALAAGALVLGLTLSGPAFALTAYDAANLEEAAKAKELHSVYL